MEYAAPNVPVVDLTNDSELAKRVGNLTGAPKYKVIQQYILDALGNEPFHLSDGKVAIVDKSDARHIAHGAATQKTAEIAEIKQLIKEAVLYAEEVDADHNKFTSFFYYKIDVKYGKDTFPVFLNVGKGRVDGLYHLYDITKK